MNTAMIAPEMSPNVQTIFFMGRGVGDGAILQLASGSRVTRSGDFPRTAGNHSFRRSLPAHEVNGPLLGDVEWLRGDASPMPGQIHRARTARTSRNFLLSGSRNSPTRLSLRTDRKSVV